MLVLDTNILLLDASNLLVPNSTVVVPETVLDEVDSKKSGATEVAYQAREVGRLISKAAFIATECKDGLITNILSYDTTIMHIVSSETYPDFTDTEPNIIADRKIIHIASRLNQLYPDKIVVFVSNDVMCRLRAKSLGLTTTDLKQVERIDFDFIKKIDVSSSLFSTLHYRLITDVDPDYKPENYNYIFTCMDTAQQKLAIILNNMIHIIGKETENELRKQDINPINREQLFFSRAILEPSIDIVVTDSLAGSGKTLVALSNAIKLVKTNTPYDSILYIRASINDVDEVEEVGFLPGLEEKFAVYLHPLYDSLDAIVQNRLKDSKLKGVEYDNKVLELRERLISDCNIKAMTTLGLRGRTIKRTVVIIDELQNQSRASLQKVLTRFGKDCKIILIGSNRQIDNKFLNKYTNGLSVVLNACTKTTEGIRIHAVTLHKVVRSAIAEWAENLFSK